jgi:hypothetical protein
MSSAILNSDPASTEEERASTNKKQDHVISLEDSGALWSCQWP